MKFVLDAGALVAIDRGDTTIIRALKREIEAGREPVTNGGVLGQVWRDGARQALLARLLWTLDVKPLDAGLAKRAGVLLGRSKRSDVIDASLTLLARDGDLILTSDPEDLAALAAAAGLDVEIVQV